MRDLDAFREHFGREPEDADELEFWCSMPHHLRRLLATHPPEVTDADRALCRSLFGEPIA